MPRAGSSRAAWPGPLTVILRRGPRVVARDDRRRRHRRACACRRIRLAQALLARVRRRRRGAEREPVRRGQPDDRGSRRRRSRRRRRLRARRRRVRASASSRRSSICRAARRCCCGPAACRARRSRRSSARSRAPMPRRRPRPARSRATTRRAPRCIAVEPHEVPAAVAARDAAASRPCSRPRAAFAAWGDARRRSAYPLPDDVAGMARELYAALRDLDARGRRCRDRRVASGGRAGRSCRRSAAPRGRTAQERP